ncbi:MAG TPA: hypothetical protein VJC39_01025 [Candidatus Nanoarchaeia archaeon]|nr:hypothetical protein [Candidatus Nanoarchaeia archaeon]
MEVWAARQEFLEQAEAVFLKQGTHGHLPAAMFGGVKSLLWGYLGKGETDVKQDAMIEAQQLYR